MQLLDSTLREGEQTPGVNFTIEQKLDIAHMVDEIGIEMIEAGHPSVSPEIKQAVRQLASEGLNAEILAHVRAIRSDIDTAIDTGVDRMVIFLPTSDIHISSKLDMDRSQILDKIKQEISYVTDHGIKVRYTSEDATRTDISFLLEACQAAVDVGADRVSIADTVGIAYPVAFGQLIHQVATHVDAKIDVHCHNDLGLAVANSLIALDNGADCVHTTVNGLGERVGIVDTATMVTALRIHHGVTQYDLECLTRLSEYVADITHLPLATNQPVVGKYAFTHTSGVHTDGILKNPITYEPFDPSLIRRQRQLHIDRYTGKRAVIEKLGSFGITMTKYQLQHIINQIKELGDRNIIITDEVILKLASNIMVSGYQINSGMEGKI